MDKDARRRLVQEDEKEDLELRSYVVQSIASEVTNMLPGGPGTSENSKLQGRQSGKFVRF